IYFFFFQAEDGIRDKLVTGVQTCALPIWVESNDAIKPLGPIPLEVDATSKIQGDLPGELERVARIYRLVKILVGRPCGLGGVAVIAIPEEEGSKAIARCTVRPGGADRGVCRRHAGIKIEQACRIVTL